VLSLVVGLLLPASAGASHVASHSAAASAATRTVDAGGIRLAYRAFGRGRPVVFLMGLGGTMDAWDPRFLDAVAAQGRRVVLLDHRGMGRSERGRARITIGRMADDAAAFIRRLGLRRPDVFGWSMGGMVAQSLAVRHPRRVRRLVLAATAPGHRQAVPPTQRALDVLLSADPSPVDVLGLLFPPGAEAPRDRYVANLLLRRDPVTTGPAPVVVEQVGAATVWLAGGDPDGPRVARLRQPALVAGGVLDDVLPFGNQARLARLIPRGRLIAYEDSGHAFMFQKRLDFLRRLDRFLG
jgi:pimeloyl-ACP methyl ester carboxylesterase